MKHKPRNVTLKKNNSIKGGAVVGRCVKESLPARPSIGVSLLNNLLTEIGTLGEDTEISASLFQPGGSMNHRKKIKKSKTMSKRFKPKRQKISPATHKKKEETDKAFIMVDMNPKGSWKYPVSLFPSHWWYDGGDFYASVDKRLNRPRYVRTEWFIGRTKSSKIMKHRLERYFEQLKRDRKVSSYRIKISYNNE